MVKRSGRIPASAARIDMASSSSEDVDALITLAQRNLWNAEARSALVRAGLHLVPANPYSAIPSVDEVRDSFEYEGEGPPYVDCGIFDREHLRSFLRDLTPHADGFSPPAVGVEQQAGVFAWDNPMFSHCDAMAYYAMVRHLRPRRIVEIGAGFSTLVSSQAVGDNGFGSILCIDPSPRDFLHATPHVDVLQGRVQEIPVATLREMVEPGDILFIDSTHVVKTGSDCLYIYLKVLPRLCAGVMIHAHDVFLPEAYPAEWSNDLHIYWNEQYLLLALLIENPRFRVCFGSNYHRIFNRDLLDRFMQNKAACKGGSLWFLRR